ncbi:MAG: hypothetical protein M5U34_05865 [Chloroflexi bacterium]|nr:hypothetical protein [Chloroflexota bacterium]
MEQWDTLLLDNQPPGQIFNDLLAYPHIVILASTVSWQPASRQSPRPLFAISFPAPDFNGRLAIWRRQMADRDDLDVTAVANHFRFTPARLKTLPPPPVIWPCGAAGRFPPTIYSPPAAPIPTRI